MSKTIKNQYLSPCVFCQLTNICNLIDDFPMKKSLLSQEQATRVKRFQVVKKREYLARQGEEVGFFFALMSGVCKNELLLSDGDKKITQIYLPGDIVGLASLGQERYFVDIIASENSVVCRIPVDILEQLAGNRSELQHYLHQVMARQLFDEQQFIRKIAMASAEQKVLEFIALAKTKLENSTCGDLLTKNTDNQCLLSIEIARNDIADYLGIRSETLSRVIGRLKAQCLIEFQRNSIEIKNLDVFNQRVLGEANTNLDDNDESQPLHKGHF